MSSSSSSKDVLEKIERQRARLARTEASIAEVEPKARQAVVEGKQLNGKVPELMGLNYTRDELVREIKRLKEVELPAARAAEAAAERQKALATARRIQRNRVAKAAELDGALAAAERVLSELVVMQRGYALRMDEAGHRQRTIHWADELRLAAWRQAPRLAGLLGVSRSTRGRASTLAELMAKLAPPAEPDPLEMPGPTPENKLVPVGSRSPVRAAVDLVMGLLPDRHATPDAERLRQKAEKKAEERRRNEAIADAIDRGEDVSHLVLGGPGPVPDAGNKDVPPRGDDPWQGEESRRPAGDGGLPDRSLSGAGERRRLKQLKREELAQRGLNSAMPVRQDVHALPDGAS